MKVSIYEFPTPYNGIKNVAYDEDWIYIGYSSSSCIDRYVRQSEDIAEDAKMAVQYYLEKKNSLLL